MKIKLYHKFISMDYLNICFLLLTFGFQSNVQAEPTCRAGFRRIAGRCLVMVKYGGEDDRSWQTARTLCVGLGGDLASLDSPELVKAADEIRKAAKMSRLNMYWIGLADEQEDGAFKWTNKKHLKEREAPWLPGEPETQNPDEDYVAASGFGWSDRSNEWTRSDGADTVLEPTGFLCQTDFIKPVSQIDEKSARPIILEEKTEEFLPVQIQTETPDDDKVSDFESAVAVVTKDKAGDVTENTANDGKADDYSFPKNVYGFADGNYGDNYGGSHNNHPNNNQVYSQYEAPSPKSYKRTSSGYHPSGYKRGHVHGSSHGGNNNNYQSRRTQPPRRYEPQHQPQRRTYTTGNHGYGGHNNNNNKIKVYSYTPKSTWQLKDNNNEHKLYLSPRKQLKHDHHNYEPPHQDNGFVKQLDHHRHQGAGYAYPPAHEHRMDGYSFDSYARQARKYDPNKSGFCKKHKPGAHAHPYNCNKFIICYANYLATEFTCGYSRKWSGNTCIEDKGCNPHVASPKRYFDMGRKLDDPTASPTTTTGSSSTTGITTSGAKA